MPKLDEYRRKRDFNKTPEPGPPEPAEGPPGDPDASARNLVFVIQQHAARRMHWDFRLEVDGVLKSWPLPNGPSLDLARARPDLVTLVHDSSAEHTRSWNVDPQGYDERLRAWLAALP